MRFSGLSPGKNIKRFAVFAAVLSFFLTLPVPAYTEQGLEDRREAWKHFDFDTSSESWKRRGETAFDLRSGHHVTSGYTRTHDGDFIKMMGFNPSWVTFRTMDWVRILFSTGKANDPKVDERAEDLPDCVPIHYGDSYVIAFDDHTYTIKLVEGRFAVGGSFARFSYRAGGTPGVEHQPRTRSALSREDAPEMEPARSVEAEMGPVKDRARVRSAAIAPIDFSGTGYPSDHIGTPSDGDEDRIDTVTVTVKIPPPAEADSPKKDDLTLLLAAKFGGDYVTLNRIMSAAQWGGTESCTFQNVRPGIYKVRAIYDNEVVIKTVTINDSNTEIQLAFPGAEDWEPEEQEGEDAGDNAPGVDQRARSRHLTPGPVNRASGWIYNLNVIVTAPPADYSGVEEADLKVEIDDPAHFSRVYNKTRHGRTRIFTFRNIPAGGYDIEVTYGDEIITDFVEIGEDSEEDVTEIEVAFE